MLFYHFHIILETTNVMLKYYVRVSVAKAILLKKTSIIIYFYLLFCVLLMNILLIDEQYTTCNKIKDMTYWHSV